MIHLFGVGRRCEALATEGLREVHHQLIPGCAIAKTAGFGTRVVREGRPLLTHRGGRLFRCVARHHGSVREGWTVPSHSKT